jgi:hypothetical protein
MTNDLDDRLRHLGAHLDAERGQGVRPSGAPYVSSRADVDADGGASADARDRASRQTTLVAAGLVGALVLGGLALSRRGSDPAPTADDSAPGGTVWNESLPRAESTTATTPITATTSFVPTTAQAAPRGSVPCAQEGCQLVFNPLPVVAGVTDFYAGPASLGEPIVQLDLFQRIVRCAELTADASACARIEGIAGVPLVTTRAAELTVDTVERSESTFFVNVGTTFASIGPEEYVRLWSNFGPADLGETTEIRGHPAWRFDYLGSPAVVWEERLGVLVWVSVPPEYADDLDVMAEGVRRMDGPTSIGHQVMVAPLAEQWTAVNNSANGLLVARLGDVECVGLDYVDGQMPCGEGIAERTIVRARFEPGGMTDVAGSVPAGVATVRLEPADGRAVTVEPVPFAGSVSRYYSTRIDAEGSITVVWLDATGTVVEQLTVNPPRPDGA